MTPKSGQKVDIFSQKWTFYFAKTQKNAAFFLFTCWFSCYSLSLRKKKQMTQLIKENDIVLSFDNTIGRMIVLRTDGICEWSGEPCSLCRCLEAHPHGYNIGYEGWWRNTELHITPFSL